MFDAYDRSALPERVLLLGTGMLLRSLVSAAVEAANRSGGYRGGIVAVEHGLHGRAEALNRAGGLFTLIERGLEQGRPIERTTVIGSITRALKSEENRAEILDLVARPEVQVIVTNSSEAGFATLPARLAPLLAYRAAKLSNPPPLLVIPTELIPENGVVLERATRQLVPIGSEVHFCSSLVDRITTAEGLLTVAEPYALWAIEGDPGLLQQVFPIADGHQVVFAKDISGYRERKLFLLNAAHTALAPLALSAGLETVREATAHPVVGPFFHHVLFEELVPGSGVERNSALEFAVTVWERFQNPFLEHRWRVIVANQTEKTEVRVRPVIARYLERTGRPPEALWLCLAAAGEPNHWSEPLKRDGALATIARFLA